MKNKIEKYLLEKNINFKESGNDQFVLEICPACGDAKFHHFYLGMESGLWDCKKCWAKGNFEQLQQLFGDVPEYSDLESVHTRKNNDSNSKKTTKAEKSYTELKYDLPIQYASALWGGEPRFLEYLKNTRKLSEEIIKRFKIGVKDSEISIPIYDTGKLVSIRYRRDPEKDLQAGEEPKYRQEKGTKASLFNGDILYTGCKEVFITEGEFDAMQLIQMGFENSVSITLGSGSFPDDWVTKLENVTTIYLVYDSDEAGRLGMKKVAEKLGFDRCRLIHLPEKQGRKKTDITNFFVDDGATKADFIKLVQEAKMLTSAGEDAVKHISEFSGRLRDMLLHGEHIGISSGYGRLDEIMGGFRNGRLIIIAGLTNVGKSSYAINLCLNMAAAKIPSLYFSLEMPPIDIAKKVMMLKAKLSNTDLKDIQDPSTVLDSIDKTFLEFKGDAVNPALPIYLYDGSGVVKYKILEECAKLAKQRFGCKAIFVDHLHYFATNFGNLAAETAFVVRSIKQLAIQLDVPIILLAHLNRSGRSKSKRGYYTPVLSDLRESGAIEQDADQVLFVCRDSESEDPDERKKCFIKVAKNRDGQAGRSVSMEFHEAYTAFVELPNGSNADYEQEKKMEEEVFKADLDDPEDLPF